MNLRIDVCEAILGKTVWSAGKAGGGPPGIISPNTAVRSLLLVPSLFVRCNLHSTLFLLEKSR